VDNEEDVCMLVKVEGVWKFVWGDNRALHRPALTGRSYCTKALSYEAETVPTATDVLNRTVIFQLSGHVAQTSACDYMIITDPPFLLTEFDPYATWLERGVAHDLTAADSLLYAPEFGGCPVHEVTFVYADHSIALSKFVWPASWPKMTIVEQYFVLERAFSEAAKIRQRGDWFIIESEFQHLDPDLPRLASAGKAVRTLSRSLGGRVHVSIQDATAPVELIEPNAADIARCLQIFRIEQESERVKEIQELSETLRANRYGDVARVAFDTSIHLSEAGRPGSQFSLKSILRHLETPNTILNAWVGNEQFGKPVPWDPYYNLFGTRKWLDSSAMQHLKRVPLGEESNFELKSLGTKRLGRRSAHMRENAFGRGRHDYGTNEVRTHTAYTLVPISSDRARHVDAMVGTFPPKQFYERHEVDLLPGLKRHKAS
jgi:hypothetical protein